MATTCTQYLGTLDRLLREVACTDRAGAALALDACFARTVELLVERLAARKAVLFVGNGGSAAIASHIVTDFFKAGARAAAFNDLALLTCMGNDYGYENVFAKPVELFAGEGDVLVAISSSGASPNILRAVAAGRERGCAVVTLSGFRPDNPLRALGDWNLYVPSPSYGLVESIHSALCHALFDLYMERAHGRPVPH
jgi:D-sedoheptulose 7-phosphate isomerase